VNNGIIIAVLLSVSFGSGWLVRDRIAVAEMAKRERDAAFQLAAAKDKALSTEQAWRDKLTQLDSKHHKELTDAQAKADSVITGLRADTIRLRKRFACPVQASASAATASVDDAAGEAGLQRKDAEFLVRESRLADECAIALTGLQEYVRELTKTPL